MLYITAVQPTGMFSYGPCDLIRLNENKLVNLTGVNEDKNGDSNGSGKTSLFNSICRILFGEDPTGVKSSEVPNVLWGRGFAGRVEFVSWEGISYRVTDCRDWKDKDYYPPDNDNKVVYKGTQLFFDKWDGSGWVDIRSESIVSTRKEVIKAVGMSYSRFLSISYLSHRVGSAFLRGKNQERLDVLSGVSGVEEWDKKLQEIKGKRTPLSREISAKASELSYKEGQLSALQQQLSSLTSTDWEKLIKQTEYSLVSLDKDVTALQQILDSVQTRYSLVYHEVNAQDPKIFDLTTKRTKLVQEQAELRAQINSPSVETEAMQVFKTEISRLGGVLQSYQGEVELAEMKECPTCGHKITKAQREKIYKKVKEIEVAIKHQESCYNKALIELRQVQEAKNTEILGEIVGFTKEIDQIDKKLQQVQEKRTEDNKRLTEVTKEFNKVNADIAAKNVEKVRLEGQLTEYQKKNIEKESALASVNAAAGEIDLLREKLKSAQDQVAIYDWFTENIPYIKLHKLSMMMKTLSDKTNFYFEAMGDTTRIMISPFKEKSKKNAADLQDLLKGEVSVEITDGGKNIDPRLYSDGETAKISNALIRALHDIAVSYGHGCNLVLLDEIFSFVDNNNSQKLAESFCRNLVGMILITDNSGVVNNLMTFDEVWVARKKGGFTVLEKGF